MHPTPDDLADNEVALGHLHPDLVTPRCGYTKDLCCLLHSFAIQADARNRRIVRDEILGDVLVEDAPVAGVVVVDRLDIAANEIFVLLGCQASESMPDYEDDRSRLWWNRLRGQPPEALCRR